MRYERVLLVNPASSGEWRGIRPHIGLGYLAETLFAEGIDHDVIDMNLGYRFRHLVDKIEDYRPDLIGMPLLTLEYKKFYALIARLKESYSDIALVAGGPHVTIMKDEVLKKCPELDYGVVSEGERTLVELCRGTSVDRITGLIRWRDGHVVANPAREPVRELDALPWPRYERFELARYIHEADIYSSRGCPHECIFCPNRLISRGFRARSPKHVVDEMEYWYDRGHRQFNFDDDSFNHVRSRVVEICDEIERRGLKELFIRCSNGVRADRMDRELLARMKEVGFRYIAFGVDAGNDRMLEIVKKGETMADIESAVAAACELGYDVKLLFVVGTPFETAEDIEDKVRLCRKYPVQDAHFYNIIPYPGTELYDWIGSNGLFLREPEDYLNDISCLNYTPVFETPELPADERVRLFRHLRNVQQDIHRGAIKRLIGKTSIVGDVLGYALSTRIAERFFYQNLTLRKLVENLRYRRATTTSDR